MTKMYRIEGKKPVEVLRSSQYLENDIEEWLANDVGLLGLNVMIIGRQVQTGHGKWIDLLAIDSSGGLLIIELKKKQTSREVVAQVLDYASWVRDLATPEIYEIAEEHLESNLDEEFRQRFQRDIPDQLNRTHSMLIVATQFDPASRRIVDYLATEHGISINAFFFDVFEEEGQYWLATGTLLDQSEVEERSDRKRRAPRSGYWYVIVQDDDQRSWRDMKKYGFVAAGGDRLYGGRLNRLKLGDKVFAHLPKQGYVGYGVVTEERRLAKEFMANIGGGIDQELENGAILDNSEDPDRAQYVIGIAWQRAFDADDGVWESNLFSNPNTVCELRSQSKINDLLRVFGVDSIAVAV